jgi:hypothetical protein
VAHTAKLAVHPSQGVHAVDVNWDTKLEKETSLNPDVRLKSAAFEIDILKPVPTVTITPTAK